MSPESQAYEEALQKYDGIVRCKFTPTGKVYHYRCPAARIGDRVMNPGNSGPAEVIGYGRVGYTGTVREATLHSRGARPKTVASMAAAMQTGLARMVDSAGTLHGISPDAPTTWSSWTESAIEGQLISPSAELAKARRVVHDPARASYRIELDDVDFDAAERHIANYYVTVSAETLASLKIKEIPAMKTDTRTPAQVRIDSIDEDIAALQLARKEAKKAAKRAAKIEAVKKAEADARARRRELAKQTLEDIAADTGADDGARIAAAQALIELA